MKRLLALMLAAALALSLVACGGGGTEDNNPPSGGNVDATSTDTPNGGGEDEVNTLAIGDTTANDRLDFTLTSLEFDTSYTDLSGNNMDYTASDGHTLAKITFAIKNTGKKSFSFQYIASIELDYNDGYLFSQGLGNTHGNPFQVKVGDTWRAVAATDSRDQIEPLDPATYEFSGYIEVPQEVQDSADTSLKVNIYLYGSGSPDFTYTVR